MARQVQSPRVGGVVKGLPREGEGQQQLSVLAPSMWEQLLDIFNFKLRTRLKFEVWAVVVMLCLMAVHNFFQAVTAVITASDKTGSPTLQTLIAIKV